MKSLLFSILIPVFNVEQYLQRCIDSIMRQTGAKFEIILMDDGSSDGSGRLCDEYASRYPGIVRTIHKQNEGLLLTRRLGFNLARGDWFICIDSDDYIASNLLSSVVEIIRNNDCDMVMYNFNYVNDQGKASPSRLDISDMAVFTGEFKQAIYEKRLLSVDVNSMWIRAVRRDIVDIDADYSQCGIRNMCEDAVQVLPLYTNANKIVYTNETLYHYRKSHDSITGKRNLDSWIASKRCFEITEKYLDIWKVSEAVRTRFYTRGCESIINFVRWLLSQNEDFLNNHRALIGQLAKSGTFERCTHNYNRNLLSTNYLRLCVPMFLTQIQKGNFKGLKWWIRFEQWLRGFLK